jgi:hypothetical protein
MQIELIFGLCMCSGIESLRVQRKREVQKRKLGLEASSLDVLVTKFVAKRPLPVISFTFSASTAAFAR